MNERRLDWLISPVTKEEYFRDFWEKRTLVIKREQPDYFRSLLSFEDVDRVITTLGRKHPDIVLKNANDPQLTSASYTLPGGTLDVASVYRLFEQGATISLAFLDTVLPALTLFCRGLESEFSCPFQTNVYMTPPGAQGAKPHYDSHDVFVLQVAGSKHWTIFGTPVESPLPGQGFDATIHDIGKPTLEFELNAGDLAYIPRGIAHEARSTDTVSLHITAGILRYTFADLLLECIAGASLKNAAFRKALPPGFAGSGFDRSALHATVANLFSRASEGSSFDEAVDNFIDKFMSGCPPMLEGQMSQLARLDQLTVESVAGARRGVISRFESDGDGAAVECYGRRILFPLHAATAVRYALTDAKFAVRDLPGNLDDEGKLTLVRRLIREGLVIAFGD